MLHLPDAEIVDVSQDKVAGMFSGSRPILDLVTLTMQEAHNAVRVLAELNALPLALQVRGTGREGRGGRGGAGTGSQGCARLIFSD